MNFELNKIFGAILGVMIFVMGIGFVAKSIYTSKLPHEPAYVIEVPDAPAEGGTPAAVVEPIAARLAKANVDKGEEAHKPCLACHGFEKGAAKKQGPGLWGVVGNPQGAHPDFGYSEAMQKVTAAGGKWTYDDLDRFLAGPKKYLPGTAMGFAGYADPQKRADLIAWLRSQDDTPEALPAP
jgi:cytochrome c